ncbi:MAG: hypothetical protein RQ739_14495 [Desulfotignum sp.]|nr:hypothetical protein [Desulfotignum sp.]
MENDDLDEYEGIFNDVVVDIILYKNVEKGGISLAATDKDYHD